MQFNQSKFKLLLDSINCCYAKSVSNKLPSIVEFPASLFKNKYLDIDNLQILIQDNEDKFLKSVALRIIAICELRYARDSGKEINTKRMWSLLSESILILPSDATISSIGSQGFLSIPLFRYESEKGAFDFIRLHIWDNSLNKYINLETCENFSVHTHTFYARSWIVFGKIINERFNVQVSNEPTEHSLFTIEYNKTLNEINQHISCAKNSNSHVKVDRISRETYSKEQSYIIKAGEFHKSVSEGENGLSATLFSFCANKGMVEQSHVVGPSHIINSEINRKIQIDPTSLINTINEKIC
jgi:hypothetical protein